MSVCPPSVEVVHHACCHVWIVCLIGLEWWPVRQMLTVMRCLRCGTVDCEMEKLLALPCARSGKVVLARLLSAILHPSAGICTLIAELPKDNIPSWTRDDAAGDVGMCFERQSHSASRFREPVWSICRLLRKLWQCLFQELLLDSAGSRNVCVSFYGLHLRLQLYLQVWLLKVTSLLAVITARPLVLLTVTVNWSFVWLFAQVSPKRSIRTEPRLLISTLQFYWKRCCGNWSDFWAASAVSHFTVSNDDLLSFECRKRSEKCSLVGGYCFS